MTEQNQGRCRLRLTLLTTFLVIFSGSAVARDPCSPSPCGDNTHCEVAGGRAVCSCLPGHFGNPIKYCTKGECTGHNDCPYNQACYNAHCKDVCTGMCGRGANCEVQNHIPVCSCPVGFTGDPFTFCRQMDPNELCNPSPCGINTNCDVINNVPTCSCLPGYKGSALKGCVHECESDRECRADQQCRSNRCRYVCTQDSCGKNARCQPRTHKPVCSCPDGHVGDPYTGCHPECSRHTDCPSQKPTCWYGRCINPCNGACGQNSDCRVRGDVAVCSCPKHMTGNPMQFCRPFSKEDLCEPNPCGGNAICQPGKDSQGKDRPVCTCPPGFLGHALYYCRKGDCLVDDDCKFDESCDQKTYECLDPCQTECGVGATCTARNHHAMCACPPGYTGDATRVCSLIPYAISSGYIAARSG